MEEKSEESSGFRDGMTIIERVARPDTVEVFDPKGIFIKNIICSLEKHAKFEKIRVEGQRAHLRIL